MNWIKITDCRPELHQDVIYYAPQVGAWVGKYRGLSEDGLEIFTSEAGFLTGDVTHWMPIIIPPLPREDY